MEGISTGCMGCMISAAGDESAMSACMTSGMTSSVDCAADPDACTCSAEDAQLLAAETMEGISTGCMGCMISAAGDESAMSACMTSGMTSGVDCAADPDACTCSAEDAQLLAAETMEGISTGCMGCMISAAGDESAMS